MSDLGQTEVTLPTEASALVGGSSTPATGKFSCPHLTLKGEVRAQVDFRGYETLWFNTGTLCNITCQNCYIESSPKNDRLSYLTRAEVSTFVDEAQSLSLRPSEIGFTGGEPFMNPDFISMLEDCLRRTFRVLVLTNAMKPMHHVKAKLLALDRAFPRQLSVRVSIDHYRADQHEAIRGLQTWQPTIDGVVWLAGNGFNVSVAGRTVWDETETNMRAGYANLFAKLGIPIDANDRARLVLFPEMDLSADVPEISEHCWDILGKKPSDMMCASSRMVVKRKGSTAPVVVSCTLLPYAPEFELGATLGGAIGSVRLNHPHCARFCVLGGASCSPNS